jgi:hypothetical protein
MCILNFPSSGTKQPSFLHKSDTVFECVRVSFAVRISCLLLVCPGFYPLNWFHCRPGHWWDRSHLHAPLHWLHAFLELLAVLQYKFQNNQILWKVLLRYSLVCVGSVAHFMTIFPIHLSICEHTASLLL